MSLQGSLETIALPDVLSLLASSSKTGELRITGRIDGRLWLQEGKLIASKVGPQPGHVEAVFQLLRLSSGEFLFQEGSTPSEPGEISAVDGVVRQAQERLAEWRVIEGAIPSLDARARLRSELPGNTVTLPADQWRMVVSIAEGLSVRQTLEGLGLGEFDGCRILKELIDGDLATIEAAPVRLAAVAAAEVTRRRSLAPVEAGPVSPAAPPVPVERNGRSALAAVANGRPAPAEVASAAVALQTRPSVRPRPSAPPPSALAEAVAAAAEAAPPVDSEPAPQADLIRARRARRLAATRDEALATQTRAARTVNPLRPTRPAIAEPAATAVAPVPEQASEPVKEAPPDEPINRGLLLKFLSSVRS